MFPVIATFAKILQILESENIPYMLVGSLASMLYGEPRITRDMDIVVQLPPSIVPKLSTIFPDSSYYLPPIEILSQEVAKRRSFNMIDLASSLTVDFIVLRLEEHAQLEFSRRQRVEMLPNLNVYIAAVEDVIIQKLVYFTEGGSHKHLEDIRGILSHTSVDLDYLDLWVTRMNLTTAWNTVE